MKRKIISLVIILCCILTTQVMAQGSLIPTKDLLMIVADNAVYDLSFINANPEMSWDVVNVSDIQNHDFDDYNEIAAPFPQSEQVAQKLIEQYTHGKKIYLYGELTINDFSNVLALEQYGVNVPIEVAGIDAKNTEKDEAFMFFSDEFASNAKHNVVALQENSSDGLLASIPQNDNGEYNLSLLMKAVVDDVSINSFYAPYATTVDYEYSIKTYDYLGHYAILDWFLYKQTESVSEYDYFGVKTNLGLEGSYFLGTKMNINMDLPFSTDEYLESGPGDSSESSSFDVNLGFGEDVSGGISWSFTIDNDPEVDRTVSLSSDYAHWVVEEDWYTLDGEIFSPGMTWASTGTYAAIDITFRGYFYNTQLSEGQWTDWKTVEVRYAY